MKKKTFLTNQPNNYLKYSGIGLQLLATVVIITYIGFWLDRHFETEKPIFSILFGVFSVVVGIVSLVRQLLKDDKKGQK